MDKKRYLFFSRFGKLIGALLLIGMVWTCSAVLNPAFDLKNQNGMPSYYYTCGDTIYITDKTTSPDGDSILAYNWTVYPSDIGKTENGIICESNLPAKDFNFTVPCPLSSYPSNFTIQLDLIGQKSWPILNSTKVNFTIDDYSEYIRANFSYSVDYETSTPNVTFFDLSEAQNLALINEWYWTLDGDQMGDEKSPVVSVSLEAGRTYQVNLSVRDKAGDIASISKDVVISEKRSTQTSGALTADFGARNTRGGAPLTVQFMDTSLGGPTAWNWVFGDGSTSSERSPTHTYLRTGSYDVILTVYNLTDSVSKTKGNFVNVDSATVRSLFKYAYPDANNTLLVNFTDMSKGTGIDAWEWNFGDGGYSFEQNPSHTYAKSGYYVVSLKAANSITFDIRSYKISV